MHVESGLEKCVKTLCKKGILVHSQNLILDFNIKIQELKKRKT